MDAFERMYRANYARVLAYALRRCEPDAAHDAVAGTFVIAWRRFGDMPPSEPLAWLLAVARKVLANNRRAERRREALAVKLAAEERPGTDSEAVPAGFMHAFESLGEDDQELLKLIAWDGLSAREAACVLEISHVACRVRLHRIRRRFARAGFGRAQPHLRLAASTNLERKA